MKKIIAVLGALFIWLGPPGFVCWWLRPVTNWQWFLTVCLVLIVFAMTSLLAVIFAVAAVDKVGNS